jgi:hypothetical protein
MNMSGRLTLVKTTLSTIPLYTPFNVELPPWLIKSMNKMMKCFLWLGIEVVQRGKCLVSWSKVQRLLELGGLGVLDLKWMDRALCTRWHLPYSFYSITLSFFCASTSWLLLGDGATFKFWSSPWLHGHTVKELAPKLFATVSRCACKTWTVAAGLRNHTLIHDIT